MIYEGNVIRPPSEARSMIIQVTTGCSHNKCHFCGAYPQKFSIKSMDRIKEDIQWLSQRTDPDKRRLFLADGNALILPADTLIEVMESVREYFPKMRRTGIYSNAPEILRKSEQDLVRLREAGLSTVYTGLESGDDAILLEMNKGATVQQTIDAVLKLHQAGIKTSVMALLGLGGNDRHRSEQHALLTAKAVSQMSPVFFSLLTVMLIPGTPLHKRAKEHTFVLPSPEETLVELHTLVENLDLTRTVFRANHASNFLSLSGTLNKDKERLLQKIRSAISGNTHLTPECFRGL